MTPELLDIWHNAIKALWEREGAMDVTALQHGLGPNVPTTYRARLFEIGDDGSLLVEKPTNPELCSGLKPGTSLQLLVVEHDQRFQASSEVIHSEPFRLNAQRRMTLVRIAEPANIRSAQRREFFRVDTTSTLLDDVELLPLFREDDAREGGALVAAVPTEPVTGMLRNISGGGLGLQVEINRGLIESLPRTTRYICVLTLPGAEEPLHIAARLVHIHPLKAKQFYLGFRFLFDAEADRQRTEDEIVRFTTDIQRRRLKRARRA